MTTRPLATFWLEPFRAIPTIINRFSAGELAGAGEIRTSSAPRRQALGFVCFELREWGLELPADVTASAETAEDDFAGLAHQLQFRNHILFFHFVLLSSVLPK